MPWLMQARPLVDVLICTYNEESVILERTIIGAMRMKYPNFRVWVLDDGRRDWLADLCAQKGCHYLTRPDNSHAKAGNINHALEHLAALPSPPDFIAVLDADFVPFSNFVSRALSLFKDSDRGDRADPTTFLQSRPDPEQPRHLGDLSRRTAILFRHHLALKRCVGVSLLLRHFIRSSGSPCCARLAVFRRIPSRRIFCSAFVWWSAATKPST